LSSLIFSKFTVCRLSFLLFLFLYFSVLFFLGGESVPDRENYIIFFKDPASSRFEPLFKAWGEVLLFLRVDSFIALYLTAASAFVFSFLVCSSVFREHFKFLVFFGFVFFAFLSVFSFVQIRASISLWIGLYLFLKFFNSGKKRYIFFLICMPFIHFLMAPFVLATIYLAIFRRIGLFECVLVFCVLVLTVVGYESFVGLIPHGDYYGQYFGGVLMNKIWLSSTVICYFLMVFFAVYFSILFDIRLSELERFSFVGFPLVLVGYFSGIDLFVKFAAPFMFLSAIFFFRRLFSVKGDVNNRFAMIAISTMLIATITYPIFKYV